MSLHLFKLELRMLMREHAAWVLLSLFTAALAYGLWNGARLAERNRKTAAELTESSNLWLAQLRDYLNRQEVDPKAVAGRGAIAVLPPPALPLLAIGQSDLLPNHENVSLWKLQAPADTRSELENPSVLLTGRFDLSFVLVWLYPLVLLALCYDLMAGDRETGTLRLGLAQGISPWHWLAQRALARALPVIALAALATLATGFFTPSGKIFYHVVLALLIVLSYGLFWAALAVAVNTAARSAAGAAVGVGAAWVLLVFVAPTLLNVVVETLYPTPSRAELVASARKASGEAEKRGGELLNSFYRDHPELAPPSQQADFAAQHLTVQSEVGRAIEPVRQKFAEQLTQQQDAIGRWRFVSPAIAVHEALTDLAGTGYWRYQAFRIQVNAFKQLVSDFYAPKIHKREALTSADYERLPKFAFNPEPARAWAGRVASSLAGILVPAFLLAFLGWRQIRPARMLRPENPELDSKPAPA